LGGLRVAGADGSDGGWNQDFRQVMVRIYYNKRRHSSFSPFVVFATSTLFEFNFLSKKIYFFNFIPIALFESNNLFKIVAEKLFFCDVLNKWCSSDVDGLRKFH
jgi:hypothetical protein